jgi:hypothetical protein
MYPNPAEEFVNIQSDIAINLVIYNANGAKVWEGDYESGLNVYPTVNISSGLYVTKVTALEGKWQNQSAIFRLIVE